MRTKFLLPLLIINLSVFCQVNSKGDSAVYYLNLVKEALPSADSLQLARAEKAEDYAIESGNDSILVRAWYLKGVLYYYSGYYEASINYYDKAAGHPVVADDPGFKYRLFNNTGINYDMLEQPDKSLENYHKALEIVKSMNNESGAAQVSINIGRLYRVMRDFDNSDAFLNHALEYFQMANDTFYTGLVYQNLASLYADMRKDEVAVNQVFTDALASYQAIGYTYGVVELYHNLGDYYQKVGGDNSKAVQYFKKALEISNQYNTHENSALLTLAIAKIAFESGNHEEAESYARQSFNIAKQQKKPSLVLEALRLLTEIAIRSGKKNSGAGLFRDYISMADSLSDIEKMKSFDELSVIYDMKNKNQQIENQKLEIAQHKLRERWLISLLVFIVALAIIFVRFMRFRTSKLRQQYQLNRQLYEQEDRQRSASAGITAEETTPETTNKHHQLFLDIINLMKNEKIFTDPDLNVSALAAKLYTNQNYISQAINAHAGINFYGFLSKQRVQEARKLIEENGNLGLSLEQVMVRSGFRSRTSFIEAFRKFTGMTPGQYQKYAHHRK